MSVKVNVREGETIASALMGLHGKVHHAYRRQWSKTRLGAYEKPSYRKRKRESLRNRNARLAARKVSKSSITVYLGLRLLMSREEVYQRKRLPFKPHRRWWASD